MEAMCGKKLGFSDVNIPRFVRQMQLYSIFAHGSVKQCLPTTRISLLQMLHSIVSQFVTITDSVDVYYY